MMCDFCGEGIPLISNNIVISNSSDDWRLRVRGAFPVE